VKWEGTSDIGLKQDRLRIAIKGMGDTWDEEFCSDRSEVFLE
jgi:hypothetical protein